MKAQTIGRALGIGLRLAGEVASRSIAGGVQSAASTPAPDKATSADVYGQAASRPAEKASGGLAHGVGGFLRPFRRVGGILWLEVTGTFFLLFAVVSGTAMWRALPSHLHGPYDKNFLAAAVMMAVFLYLGVSSFWRARKR
jgi:hypothetical protein